MQRRAFLRGSAVVSVPLLVSGCGLSLPLVGQDAARASRPEDRWLEYFDIDDRSLARTLEALGANGADFGEAFFQHRATSTVRLSGGSPVTVDEARLEGAGLRVVRGGQSGFRSTTSLGTGSLLNAAMAAAAALSNAEPVLPAHRQFLAPGSAYSSGDIARDDARLKAIVTRLESLVRNADATIVDVDVTLTSIDEWVLIATLDGRLAADRRPMTRLSVQAVMRRGGETQSGFAAVARRQSIEWLNDNALRTLADLVVARTEILFDARRPPAGEMPVLLAAGTGGVLIHESLGHAFEADFVRAGRSPFSLSSGSVVAGPNVTVVDDATMSGQRGALNVDDEGERGQKNVLVENGRLRSLVHDKRSALAEGLQPTGNGRRESFAHQPMPRMTCTFIGNGTLAPEDLIESTERAVLAETFTGGAVDLGGGDFRFRVKHGWLIENGRRTVPVRDFELIGNGAEMLRGIRRVANDGRLDDGGWTCRKNGQSVPVSQGTPTLLVASLGVNPLS